MDVLTSSEFRKRYAKLTHDTRVTVNGHVIGTWSPAGVAAEVHRDLGLGPDLKVEFDARPVVEFRPAPKPSRRS